MKKYLTPAGLMALSITALAAVPFVKPELTRFEPVTARQVNLPVVIAPASDTSSQGSMLAATEPAQVPGQTVNPVAPEPVSTVTDTAAVMDELLANWPGDADLSYPDLPDFSLITDIKEKKQAFFNFLAPAVDDLNLRIVRQRAWLEQLLDSLDSHPIAPAAIEQAWQSMLQEYRMDETLALESGNVYELLNRVDQVPLSLVLVQAANESAWGTSRFAREGNNLFGQWCFSPGCGLVPAGRPEGQTYEVRSFDNAKASVYGYLLNINTHNSYLELRLLRSGMRATEDPLDPALLAHGLGAYSTRGSEYIGELISMLSFNQELLAQAGGSLDI